jgi:hypothetical protein
LIGYSFYIRNQFRVANGIKPDVVFEESQEISINPEVIEEGESFEEQELEKELEEKNE